MKVQCRYSTTEVSGIQRQDWPIPSAAVNTTSRIQALEGQVQRLTSRLSNGEDGKDEAKTSPTWQTSGVVLESRFAYPAFSSNSSTPSSTGFALRLSPEAEIAAPKWSVDHLRQLWEVYLADIDPFLKILDHQYVEDTLNCYPKICPTRLAVLIAIVFAYTACKTPDSLAEYHSYAKALENALQSANTLSQPSIPTLQALTIYLNCGRLNMDQEYLGTMLILLIRLAMRLRLDQDPADLGFEPDECEHRRLLWWSIIALDVRQAEACGSRPWITSRHIVTKIPSMVREIACGIDEGFEASESRACTCYSTMSFEMAKIARQVQYVLAPAKQGMPQDELENELRELSDQMHSALLAQYLQFPDCADSPVCRLTIQWCSIYWTRLKLLVSHSKRLFLRQVTDISTLDHERDLLDCISILNRVARLRTDAEYSRWAWLWQNCVEWDGAAIALCLIATNKCSVEAVGTAWIALDSFFRKWRSGNSGDSAHRRRWDELVAFRDWVRTTG